MTTHKAMPFDPDDKILELMGFQAHDGYFGVFTRGEYPGGIRNGTRVVKCNSEKGDTTPDGDVGTVMGSFGHPDLPDCICFIEWDREPKVVVGCMGSKLRKEE